MRFYSRKEILETLGIDEGFVISLEREEILQIDSPQDADSPYSERMLERVRVPQGSAEGTQIRLSGQGEGGSGGAPAGDLYLRIRIRPHRFFTRDGDDLGLELPVSVSEAVRGASVEVPTPEGSVSLKIPPRSRAGQKLRLRGKGVTSLGGKRRGDLYVTLRVELPDARDPSLDERVAELDAFYTARDLRAHLKSP